MRIDGRDWAFLQDGWASSSQSGLGCPVWLAVRSSAIHVSSPDFALAVPESSKKQEVIAEPWEVISLFLNNRILQYKVQ